MRRHAFALLALAAAACGPKVHPTPPAIFPAATRWTTPFDSALEGPVATDGARAYLATGDGSLRSVDLATGAVVWRVRKRGGLVAASPSGLVVKQVDGTMWSVDPATGAARWKAVTGITGPMPPVIAGNRVLVGGQGLEAFDLATGGAVWALPAAGLNLASPPLVHAGRVYVGTKDGGLRAFAADTGAALWAKRVGSAPLGALAVADGRLYAGVGERRFAVFDLQDGSRGWQWRLGAGARFEPAVLDRHVLFVTLEGVLYALNRKNGHLDFRAGLPSRPASGPLVLGGAVLVATHGTRPGESLVVAVDGRSGRRLGDLTTPAELAAQPLLVGDTLLLALKDRNALTAVRLGAPDQP